ncbi:MAG: HEAT repeat domain-containing protein [Gemmataceae bacterium]|nr:HEAT repeat domain-containing protein [Gemmataceae bacterium]
MRARILAFSVAYLCLCHVGPKAQIPGHDPVLGGQPLSKWRELLARKVILDKQGYFERIKAIDELVKLGPPVVGHLKPLLKRDDSPEVKRGVCFIFGKLGPAAGKAVPEILEALDSPKADGELKETIANALFQIQLVPQEAIPVLDRLMAHGDPLVRGLAANSVGRLDPPAKDMTKALVKLLKDDKDPGVKVNAAGSLARIAQRGALPEDAAEPLWESRDAKTLCLRIF